MTMKNEEATSRRDFLKLAGTATPTAAVAMVVSGTQAQAAGPAEDDQMQDNAHTRAYFDSARF